MNWIEVMIEASPAGREMAAAALMGLGITQVEMVEDTAILQGYLDEISQYWDYVDADALTGRGEQPGVRFYLPTGPDAEEKLAAVGSAVGELRALAQGFDPGSLRILRREVDDEDWAHCWKKYYKPLPIGSRLLVVPEWEEVPGGENRIVLRMDPGMVFGSGQHETTSLCLEQLERRVTPGCTVLDAGCGSGILSIAALLLGAGRALGVDIDPLAPDIVRENGVLNGLSRDRLDAISGNILKDPAVLARVGGGYDIVVANIVADVIAALTPGVPEMLRPGGLYIASGIIEDQLPRIRAAMEDAGLTIAETGQKGPWCVIVARLPGEPV